MSAFPATNRHAGDDVRCVNARLRGRVQTLSKVLEATSGRQLARRAFQTFIWSGNNVSRTRIYVEYDQTDRTRCNRICLYVWKLPEGRVCGLMSRFGEQCIANLQSLQFGELTTTRRYQTTINGCTSYNVPQVRQLEVKTITKPSVRPLQYIHLPCAARGGGLVSSILATILKRKCFELESTSTLSRRSPSG